MNLRWIIITPAFPVEKKNNCNLSLKIKMHYFRKKKRKNLEFSKKGREINYDSMDFMFRLNY